MFSLSEKITDSRTCNGRVLVSVLIQFFTYHILYVLQLYRSYRREKLWFSPIHCLSLIDLFLLCCYIFSHFYSTYILGN